MTPRHAVLAAFGAFGVGFGMWAGSIAITAGRSGVTPQVLGFAVMAFIAASLCGMAAAGVLSRFASLKTILLSAIAATAVCLAVLMQAASPLVFVAGIVLFGFVNGIYDGTMNAEGTIVEGEAGRPILSSFHATSSLTLAPAAVLGSMIAVEFGTVATAAIAVCAYAIGATVVMRGMPMRHVAVGDLPHESRQWRFGRPIVLLGLIVGISMAGEAAALMFSAPALTAQAPELAGYAGFGASVFALCQGLMRLVADRLRRRLGDLRVIELSIVGATLGFLVVATSGSFVQSAAGFALVGVGTACLVPCGFSLAPLYSRIAAAQALGILALVTALPRVPAPLIFGEVAERFDFAAAFALNAALFAAAFAAVLMLRRSSARADEAVMLEEPSVPLAPVEDERVSA